MRALTTMKRNRRAVAAITAASISASVLLSACATRMPQYAQPDFNSADAMTRAMDSVRDRFGGNVQSQSAQTDDGVQVVMQSGHAQDISQTAMSSDGREILTASQDGTVKLWDVASGQELRTFSGFSLGMMERIAFSADGRIVVISDGIQTHLFDHVTGQKLQTLDAGTTSSFQAFTGSAFVASGGRYAAKSTSDPATGRNDSSVRVIELASGRTIWSTPEADSQVPLALSDDGKVLLIRRSALHTGIFRAPSVETTVEVWDVGAKKPRGPLPFDDSGTELALSPDGRYVIREGALQPTQLYALDSAQPLATLSNDGSGYNYFERVEFSADGTMALRATDHAGVEVWQIPSGNTLYQVPGTAASFGPNGRTLVLGVAGSGAPVVHDLATKKNTPLSGGAVAVWELAALAGGRSAAATMQDGSVRLWDLATGQLKRNLDCPEGSGAASVATDNTTTNVAIGCSDGSAWLWTLGASEPVARRLTAAQLPQGSSARTLVRLSADGRRIVVSIGVAVDTAGNPANSIQWGTISVHDVADGREITRFTLPDPPPDAFEPSYGDMSADDVASSSKEAREAMERATAMRSDPKMRAQMRAAAATITDVAIHPNGKWVVAARANDVTVWDVDTGALVQTLGSAPPPTDPAAAARDSAQNNAQSLFSRLGIGGAGMNEAQLQALMKQQGASAMVSGGAAEDAIAGLFKGALRVMFRADGALLTLSGGGPRLWDVTSGQPIPSALERSRYNALMNGGLMQGVLMGGDLDQVFERVSDAAFSPDGRVLAMVDGSQIRLHDALTARELGVLRGHRTDIASIAFTPDGERLLSGGRDGVLRIWSVPHATELAQLIALGHADFVAVTPDQYYRASRSRIKGIAFRVGEQLYPFEQFDLRFNRPDIVLERLGLSDAASIQTYRQSYQKRLKKLGFTEAMLGTDFHLPSVALVATDIPVATDAATLPITISASDDKYTLDRFQVFVNDVPVFGTRGVAISGGAHSVQTKVDVPLVAGRNKIQVSALNSQGVESLRQTAYTNATGRFPPGDIYVVTIGVSKYANAAYNLRYAAKDAGDFAAAYSAAQSTDPSQVAGDAQHGAIHVLSLTNEHATREQIRAAKEWLGAAKTGDLAIVFAAGHGMTDSADNYYFGTYDIDPANPSAQGLPYEDFEALLDGIAPLRKMLLIDTCFSGEIDKDDAVVVARSDDSTQGQVSMRAFKTQRGVQIVADDSVDSTGALASTALRFQQDWFADLRRGTGAVVISSASGNEYAFEGEQWNNGVFTYALLQGLRNGAADADHNQSITVGELQAYVIEQVRQLTAGGQNPTVRRENLDYDFQVY
jgi:WD40 repeat protein